MKRLLSLVIALTVFCAVNLSAQGKWGVTAGMNFATSDWKEVDVKARTGWSAGLTYLADLPLGLSIQPSLIYHQKGANITEEIAGNMGVVEIPVSLQWGPDLLLFRPFVDVTPYIGYALTNDTFTKDGEIVLPWEDKERLEYGVGIGGGINVWKLQVIARYNWSFGSVYNWEGIKNHFPDLAEGSANENFSGVTVGVSFLF
jgi:hypothetical protein